MGERSGNQESSGDDGVDSSRIKEDTCEGSHVDIQWVLRDNLAVATATDAGGGRKSRGGRAGPIEILEDRQEDTFASRDVDGDAVLYLRHVGRESRGHCVSLGYHRRYDCLDSQHGPEGSRERTVGDSIGKAKVG